jgi:protein-S-isoprenylcysteine O-methyltransferase Ste14
MSRRPLPSRGWKKAPSGKAGDEDLIDRVPWPRRKVDRLPWWARSASAPRQVVLPALVFGVGVGVLIAEWLDASTRVAVALCAVVVGTAEVVWSSRQTAAAPDERWPAFARLFFRRR